MTWEAGPQAEDWDKLIAQLKDANSVLLVAHVSPDGDALGSALAVGLALRQLGISAVVSFDDGQLAVPASLSWMPGLELLVAVEDVPPELDVAVSFDASSIERLGRLGPICKSAKALFAAVDHHRSYTGYAELSLVDVTAPATAVLALEFVDRLGAELTTDIATCVYTGLTTDTGSFKFAGTTAGTHRIAARLHEADIKHDVIARAVFDDQPFAALQLLGLAVAHATLYPQEVNGLGLVATWISRADRHALGLALDAAEPIINSIRSTTEAEVAVVLKEGDDGIWRVSTRSKGAVDMGAVCSALGGGGHRFAAGFTSNMSIDDTLAALIAEIDAIGSLAVGTPAPASGA